MYWASLYEAGSNRHEDRARYWERMGKSEFAAGSRRKAARWRERGRELEMALMGPFPKDVRGVMLDFAIAETSKKISVRHEQHVLGPR